MIHVNVFGVLYCTHAALPLMREQGSGHIVNVSSVAGRFARAGSGVYNLTKFGVGAFSESLRQEVAPHGMRVTLIEPGAVATELPDHNRPEIQEVIRASRRRRAAARRGHRRRHPLRDRRAAERARQRGAGPARRPGSLSVGAAPPARSPAARRPAWSTCSVVWSSPKRSCSSASISRRARWQSALGVHQHVRRQRREAARDLPHVQVVHLHHARQRDQRLADLLGVEARGRRLEEDRAPRPTRAPARADHQRRRSAARRSGRRAGSR